MGTCSSSFVSRCRGPASSDSSVLEHWGGKNGPFGAFFLSLLKMDRSDEVSRDMVTLRKKDMLRMDV